MTKEEKFVKRIEKISMRIDERIEMLQRHEVEYTEKGKMDLANDSCLKYRQLEMVSKDLWNALASIA